MRIGTEMLASDLMPMTEATNTTGGDFTAMFKSALGSVDQLQQKSESLIERLAAGEQIPPEVLAAAVNKADLAFRTMIQIRNKLVSAFEELRQMQI